MFKYDGPKETLKGETHAWLQIRSDRGFTGYIWAKHLCSALDFRAGFKKVKDKWVLRYFNAGD